MILVLSTVPPSTNHVYKKRGQGHGLFMTQEGKDYKETVGYLAKAKWGPIPSKQPIVMKVVLQFPDKRRRDIDGYHKLLQDSMEHIVYENDDQIIDLHISKTIGTLPQTIISVEEL